ncbi:MAG: DUF4340 domain-containing protein [Oscillospiraceae bacterium]|nr:DUF4340 domain-containing protein [Oscillospiraceae bacterium]
MNQKYKILILVAVLVLAVGGIFLVQYLTRDSVIDGSNATDATNNIEGETITFTEFSAEEVSSIHIANVQSGEEYTVMRGGAGFFIVQVNELVEQDLRLQIPFNQNALSELAEHIATLSSNTSVERDVYDLAQFGLSDDDPVIRVGAIFDGGNNIRFFLGERTPDGRGVYFRLADSGDVYVLDWGVASFIFRDKFHWLERNAFPDQDPNIEIERVTIDRIDWRNAEEGGVFAESPMVIEPLPSYEGRSGTFNLHQITSPVQVEICQNRSLSILHGLFGLSASEIVAVAPDEVALEQFGFINEDGIEDPTLTVRIDAGGQTFILTVGTRLENETGEIIGWLGKSNHAPIPMVFLFDSDVLPWLFVSVDTLLAENFLQPYIYSVDRVIIETSEPETLEFRITGDAEGNRIYFNGEYLTGTSRDSSSERGRFASLYMFLISVSGEELFVDEIPDDSELIARVTYIFRDDSRDDDVIEFYTADNFRSIIRVNGVTLFKIRDRYTSRLLSNLNAFVDGSEIINDW